MRDKPHRNRQPQQQPSRLEWPGGVVPEWARPAQGQRKRRNKARGGGDRGGKRERLQKVMAQSGHGSRRNIEILIAQGHITINGQVAKLGDSVGPGDKVKLDGELIKLRFGADLPRVLLYHKPEGEIVTRDDPEGRATVFEKLPRVQNGRWVSIGRLDINTGGLLIFTTNGELANRFSHPRFEVEREYAVRVLGELTEEQKAKLLSGVEIEGETCKFDSIEERGGDGANRWYHVVLREGKNREVRKMMEAVGLTVSRLMRVRFGNVQLPQFLKRGMMRELNEQEVQNLIAFAGMGGEDEEASDEEDDDALENIGNVAHPSEVQARQHDEFLDDEEDNVGNRIIDAPQARDVEGHRPAHGQGQGQGQGQGHGRRAPGSHKPFFGKKRGQGQGGAGHKKGGGQARHAQQGQPAGHGSGGHGSGQGQPQPQGQGQGKPGRHRRNKNRHRNRGATGEQQPPSNANRDPF